jgi:hypothetical protein
MPQKKRAKKTTDSRKIFFKSFGEGISAVLRVNEDGGLDACQTTKRGGKLVKPYKWGSALPIGSIEPDDRIDIIMLGEGFADVYAISPHGKISSRRIGLRDSKWVHADDWITVHNPVESSPPRKVADAPSPKQDAPPVDDDDDAPDIDPDAVRKEAMRKRGVMLEQHATAGK